MLCTSRSAICLICVLLVTGCTQFPELDQNVSLQARNAPFPDLVPTEDLQLGARSSLITNASVTTIEGRVSALRARAARLRGSVIDRGTRARLQQTPSLPEKG